MGATLAALLATLLVPGTAAQADKNRAVNAQIRPAPYCPWIVVEDSHSMQNRPSA
jgi:hypothetical protein